MPENVLTSDAESAAPPTEPTVAADEAAPHDVAPPEPEPQPALETPPMEPPPSAVEEPPPPSGPEKVVAEEPAPTAPTAPPEPTNPQLLAAPVALEEAPVAEAETDGEAEAETPPAEPVPEPSNKRWYVVKVQSNREETIKEAIERRVKIERLEEFFGQIVIPVERVTEMRKGKRVVKEKKLYPGYLMAEVELVDAEGGLNDRILYLFRETSGVGDFVGMTMSKSASEKPRPPSPMSPREVERMLGGPNKGQPSDKPPEEVKPPVERGDRVKVRDGTFAGMEGEVKEIVEKLNRLKVELTIFGRPVSVELEYWQVETV